MYSGDAIKIYLVYDASTFILNYIFLFAGNMKPANLRAKTDDYLRSAINAFHQINATKL